MFVLSEAQVHRLLQLPAETTGDNVVRSLVDVGAGDGEVSRRFAHLYSAIYATEISGSMQKMLTRKGYT